MSLVSTQPWYIFVGPEKTGTTWIHELLTSSSSVLMPRGVKETFFFDRYFDKGMSWYLSHFADPADDARVVEVAPSYFSSRLVAERIRREIPNATIICSLRDPVERTLSLYQHLLRYGWTNRPLKEAIEQFPFLISGSRYHARLAEWRDIFAADRVRVCYFDDLARDPAGFATQVGSLIGLTDLVMVPTVGRVVNGGGKPRNYWLAKTARHGATWLRRNKAYPVIEAMRRLGLKKFIYGGKPVSSTVAVEDSSLVWSLLEADLEQLRVLLGSVPASWGWRQ